MRIESSGFLHSEEFLPTFIERWFEEQKWLFFLKTQTLWKGTFILSAILFPVACAEILFSGGAEKAKLENFFPSRKFSKPLSNAKFPVSFSYWDICRRGVYIYIERDFMFGFSMLRNLKPPPKAQKTQGSFMFLKKSRGGTWPSGSVRVCAPALSFPFTTLVSHQNFVCCMGDISKYQQCPKVQTYVLPSNSRWS